MAILLPTPFVGPLNTCKQIEQKKGNCLVDNLLWENSGVF